MPIKKQRKFLGPAQMGAVLGYDNYLSANDVRDEIENGYEVSGNYATSYGQSHEDIALYYYQKLYEVEIEKAQFVVDPTNRKIGGICDGLIGNDTGIEIKCHIGKEPLMFLPNKFLVQLSAYMYLYGRTKWLLFSCCFNPDHSLAKYNLFEVDWSQVSQRWINDWKPKLDNFVNHVKWQTPEKKLLEIPPQLTTIAKAPATKAPATKAPATKAPATKAPATKAPATKAIKRSLTKS